MPLAGCRNENSELDLQDTVGYYWSSSPYGSFLPERSYYLNIRLEYVQSNPSYLRAFGASVRLFYNTYITPDNTRTVEA